MRLCLLALPLAALAAPNPEILGRIPLYFEPNVGQAPASARFIARGGGLTVYLSPGETTLASKGDKVKMKLEGSRQAAFEGLELQPGVSNYYRGNDPAKWRTGVPHYGRVISRGVYEGIDLVYYGNARRIEYDFVVAPGASPDAIQLAYEGADKIRLDDRGDLVLTTHSGELRQHKPLVYQEVAGRRVEVGANYRLRGSKVGFELASYDHGKPLVIDPVVSYGTLLGGSGNDRALGVGIDSSGAIYVGGSTESANFPLLGAADSTKADLEGFVTKLNSAGAALVFSTYFGGSGRDDVSAFAIQPNGNSFLTGATFSNDLPVASAFQASVATVPDAFAAKFNPDGTLAYATYLGGSGDDRAFAIAVDSSGNAYVAGGAASANFPGAPGNGAFSNAFVSKLSPAGSSLLFTYRAPSFGSDSVHGVAVDATGIYIAGSTEAPNFPVAPAPGALQPAKAGTSRDAFVAKVRPDGSGLLYGTYLGGASLDEAKAIAVDASGNAYVTGYTSSNDFPVRSAMFPAKSGSAFDAFVTKINAGGTALVYSTYLGGANGHDLGNAIAVDSLGRATVGGSTESADFPTYSAYQTLLLLYRKGFLAPKLCMEVAFASRLSGALADCPASVRSVSA